MGWDARYTVLIGAGEGDSPELLGTGFYIAPQRVLTARHVVLTSDGVRAELRLKARDGKWTAAGSLSVLWAGETRLDVAVLEAPSGSHAPQTPSEVLSEREVPSHAAICADGYPTVLDWQPSSTWEQVQGTACACGAGQDTLNLDVTTRPEVIKGLSGGAVVLASGAKLVCGVFRGDRSGWSGGRVTATPVAKFFRYEAFRKAAGLPLYTDRYESRVVEIIQKVDAIVGRSAQLEAMLRTQLGCASGPLAEYIVRHTAAERLSTAMIQIDGAPGATVDASTRQELRSLFRTLLPYAVRWSELRERMFQHEALPDTIELPMRSNTVAEVVVAGIENRECNFVCDENGEPCGAAVVHRPAAVHAALWQRGGRSLLESVIEELAGRFGVGGHNTEEKRKRVAAELRQRQRRGAFRYYLVFHDEFDRGRADEMWRVAVDTLGRDGGLPSLALVRMTGELSDDEAEFESDIRTLFGAPDASRAI